MNNNSGFTLIELIAVIFIMSVLFAISIPNILSWRSNKEFNACIRQSVSIMRGARMHAVKENAPALVLFDSERGTIRSFVDRSRSNTWEPGEDMLIGAYEIPHSIDVRSNFPLISGEGDIWKFRYNARGAVSRAGTVTFEGQNGRNASVVVARSGRIRID